MITTRRCALGAAFMSAAMAVACSPPAPTHEAAAPGAEAAPAAPAVPAAVNGWREYPLREGVIAIHPAKWKSETIDIPVPANGGDLEYKLAMKKGDTIVYAINYADLEHPGMMVVEFHGHTEKAADGNGDLMFYSKTGGVAETGSFTAPWDGVHGWYLKNDSTKNVTAKLELAGFYEHAN